MKKLSIVAAALSLSIATPVFACPGHDEAPRTAEKAKPAEKADKSEKAAPAKTADKAAKPADKVSQK